MYGLTLVTPATEEPVSLAEAKEWLRDPPDKDDALVAGLVRAARILAEGLYSRQLVTATWRLTIDTLPGQRYSWGSLDADPGGDPRRASIRLPKAPLQSVTSVQYLDTTGALQTLATTVYEVDAASDPGRLSLAPYQIWPITWYGVNSFRVTYVAGYGVAAAVPPDVKTAIKMIVANLYERRGDDSAGLSAIPKAAEMLLQANWHGCPEVAA